MLSANSKEMFSLLPSSPIVTRKEEAGVRSLSRALRLVLTSPGTQHPGCRGGLVHSGLPHMPLLYSTAGEDQVPLLQSGEDKSALL